MFRTTLLILFLFPAILSANTIIVDINGSGNFTSIQAGINAAVTNDTVKVLPGVYNEAINLSKNIILMGSGYEVTTINSNSNPTVTMSSGKIMWFEITSNTGNGINLSSGIVTNCVVLGCAQIGINLLLNSSGIIHNCITYLNGSSGIHAEDGANTAVVYNSISWANSGTGFIGNTWPTCDNLNVTYCCGSTNGTIGNVGNINIDPQFTNPPYDFHISSTSSCWDSGKPGVYDPDGSPSDMGYFGGPDCPIYPVVTNITITPLSGGGVQVQATGVANY